VLVFRGRSLGGVFVENEETHGFEFFDTASLPEIVPTHRQRIDDLLANRPEVVVR
jgi:hypothetical protein